MWFSALLYLPFPNFPPTQACHLYFFISFIFLSVITTTTTTTTTTIPFFALYLINYKHTWKRNIYIYIYTCILGRTYSVERSIHLIEEHWLLIITGVQASGVIIYRLLRQCCFVWSEIVGPHSSGNFNDWPLKLKAGSKYRDALRDSI